MRFKIGDIVKVKDSCDFILRSGSGFYSKAVVIQEDPLVLSTGDMRWESTIKNDYFEAIGKADAHVLERCNKRLKE